MITNIFSLAEHQYKYIQARISHKYSFLIYLSSDLKFERQCKTSCLKLP